MAGQETPVLIVAGPTASGKTSAAGMLGRMLSGHVINADSMQVYRDLRVLTARPDAQEQARVPHHLYGHVDASEGYSAGRFVREAAPIIEGLRAEGTVPIICGGTGLYLDALTRGLSPMPDVPARITADAGRRWDADPEAFRAALLAADPPMERLEPGDRQRHVRAAAVLEATGRPLSQWQSAPRQPMVPGPFISTCLIPPRTRLYVQCDARLARMVEAGALDEVRRLMARGLPSSLPVMKALGVAELSAHLRGALSLDEAVELAAQETRRFAKRQVTWFRNQTSWPAYETPEELVAAVREALA